MFFRKAGKGPRRIRCWSAWVCGILVIALLSLPYYTAIRAAASGRSAAIPVLAGWTLAIAALLFAFRWEKRGGLAVILASLASGAALLFGYKSPEPMLDLIVTLLLLMSGILFLQCWQRKKLSDGK